MILLDHCAIHSLCYSILLWILWHRKVPLDKILVAEAVHLRVAVITTVIAVQHLCVDIALDLDVVVLFLECSYYFALLAQRVDACLQAIHHGE